MSHQDQDGRKVRFNADYLQQALRWLWNHGTWDAVRFRSDCSWTPCALIAAAMVWAWSDELTLGERFKSARKIIALLYQPQREFAGSYQAFLKILSRWTELLVGLLQAGLRTRMREALAAHWEVHGFALFGVDGSRIELPRTRSNEAAYSAELARGKSKKKRHRGTKGRRRAAHAKKANVPQMWLTTMWHAVTGLPWDWRLGPANSSEREHWMQMLPQLPERAMVAADAGFVGYEYAQAVINSGRQLLLRVGANVRLLRKLGCARESQGLVHLWPDSAARGNKPPITLRLVVVHNGKHPVYLVTSVLAAERLSDEQVADLYRRRWGIEVFYRHLKQTFGRRKLRSASAVNARVEIEWSLIGLWAMGLYAQAELARCGIPPSRLSIAKVLRAFRRTLRDYRHPAERGVSLSSMLREAILDGYKRRNKASRDYPRKKQETPPGAPTIVTATRQQVAHAKQLKAAERKGLTA